MKPLGIHNKFAPKKANVPNRNEVVDTEHNLGEKPTITLDGDSYALKFNDATMENIKDRLFDFLYDVKKEQHKALEQYGIQVYQTDNTINVPLATGGSVLKTKKGYISVRTGRMRPREDDVFRVIGFALSQLPIHTLMDKHDVVLINRR